MADDDDTSWLAQRAKIEYILKEMTEGQRELSAGFDAHDRLISEIQLTMKMAKESAQRASIATGAGSGATIMALVEAIKAAFGI